MPNQLLERGAGEGPAWHPELGLLTSGGGHVMRRGLDGRSEIFLEDAGSNGLLFDRQGRLLICEPVRRCVSRRESDGTITVLTDQYGGRKYNQPNDLTVDSQGRIYFSDPRYGDRSGMEMLDESGRPVEGVYRIDRDGSVTRIINHEVDRPNGVLVAADDRHLFVADNNNNTVGGARKLWRFDLQSDGSVDLTSRRLVYDWGKTRGPDGMAQDRLGRLYVAAGLNRQNAPYETQERPTAGVYVFSPDGDLLDFVPVPRDECTNCAFGGEDLKTLFITAGGTLWSVRTESAGRPTWPVATESDGAALADALLFHAPFDGEVDAAFSRGDGRMFTAKSGKRESAQPGNRRSDVELLLWSGRYGGSLRFKAKSPDVVFFAAEKNVGYSTTDWSGTVSFWMRLDPSKDLEPGFADPIQITERRWNDAAFFVDFTKENPRDFRLGVFSDFKHWNPNETPYEQFPEEKRPMVTVHDPPFRRDRWTHVAFTFAGLNNPNSAAGRGRPVSRWEVSGLAARAVSVWLGRIKGRDHVGAELHRRSGRLGRLQSCVVLRGSPVPSRPARRRAFAAWRIALT